MEARWRSVFEKPQCCGIAEAVVEIGCTDCNGTQCEGPLALALPSSAHACPQSWLLQFCIAHPPLSAPLMRICHPLRNAPSPSVLYAFSFISRTSLGLCWPHPPTGPQAQPGLNAIAFGTSHQRENEKRVMLECLDMLGTTDG